MTVTADQPSTPVTGLPPGPAPRTRDTRWELAAALRTFGRLGYEFGFNGHVSARAPEASGHYWVNPFGVSISAVVPSDFVLVGSDGEIASRGSYSINGFAGNLALHQAVPEAAVVVHLHTPSGFVWSGLGRPLEPVNTDSALVTGLQGLSTKIWGDDDGPSNVELATRGARIILQQGHGFVTWGESVGEAGFYLQAAERAAHANLALLGVSGRQLLGDEQVARWGLRPDLARAHFEPSFTLQEAEGLR
jgi:ribulose-5-phosphate 4-epimerase/fuculose-1-phosphate aldolase